MAISPCSVTTSMAEIVQRFEDLFAQTKYTEAVELAADSPQGILRTLAKLQSVPVEAGRTPPLLHYFGILLKRGKLNAFESLELSRIVLHQNNKNLLDIWLADDKLECSVELGDLVKSVDTDLAQKIYVQACGTPEIVAPSANSPDDLLHSQTVLHTDSQIVQRFQELFAQTKYTEAVELAAESPHGILRTPDTLAKLQSVPVEAGQTPPLLHYFGVLLRRGKLNAFESLELSRIVLHQNKKNLLDTWLADDKLECSEELGDLAKTVDDELALKIYIKARATLKVVAAFSDRKELDLDRIFKNLFPQVEFSPNDLLFLQTLLRTDPQLIPLRNSAEHSIDIDDNGTEGGSNRKVKTRYY